MQRIVTGAVVALILLGCKDATSPSIQREPGSPAFAFSNGPETPGPIVFRTTDDPFFLFFDDDRTVQLAAIMRPGDPAALIPCGGSNSLNPVDLQLVFHSSGAINQTLIGRDIDVWLYARRDFLIDVRDNGLCHALVTQIPLYHGTASLVAHDNDTFFSGTHPDAFGFSAVGTVTKISDGSRYRYQNEYHGVLGTDGAPLSFHASIRLSPL